jgi:hypothetical protein
VARTHGVANLVVDEGVAGMVWNVIVRKGAEPCGSQALAEVTKS